MKRFLLLIAGFAAILVGVVSFAAFESHIVKIKAHVETATYTSPGDINFGTLFPEEDYTWCERSDLEATGDAECTGEGCPPPGDKCLKIGLSESFKRQSRVKDVDYKIYCEGPQKTCKDGEAGCEEGWPGPSTKDQPITPFIELESDGGPGDIVAPTVNCIPKWVDGDKGKPGHWAPVEWATGKLVLKSDPWDQWDLTLWAPACKENYNDETDPYSIDPVMAEEWPADIPHIVDFCKDGEIDLSGAIKFQVTGYSYCTCRAGEETCECE